MTLEDLYAGLQVVLNITKASSYQLEVSLVDNKIVFNSMAGSVMNSPIPLAVIEQKDEGLVVDAIEDWETAIFTRQYVGFER